VLAGNEIILLYKGFVKEFEDKIDEFILMEIVIKVTDRMNSLDEQITFLDELQKRLIEWKKND